MQGLPLHAPGRGAAISGIGQQGVAQMLHMHPDLVGTPGEDAHLQQGRGGGGGPSAMRGAGRRTPRHARAPRRRLRRAGLGRLLRAAPDKALTPSSEGGAARGGSRGSEGPAGEGGAHAIISDGLLTTASMRPYSTCDGRGDVDWRREGSNEEQLLNGGLTRGRRQAVPHLLWRQRR